MSVHLTTAAALAEQFEISVDELHRLRKRHNWPHVRLSRFEYRFTTEHVEQIIASLTVVGKKSKTTDTGLTDRSAARAS